MKIYDNPDQNDTDHNYSLFVLNYLTFQRGYNTVKDVIMTPKVSVKHMTAVVEDMKKGSKSSFIHKIFFYLHGCYVL